MLPLGCEAPLRARIRVLSVNTVAAFATAAQSGASKLARHKDTGAAHYRFRQRKRPCSRPWRWPITARSTNW
ncbi:hypothetical protein EMIT0215P_190083 [Pseudomonas serboccidentalis]